MSTIGPMYVAEQQAKAAQPVVSTTTVDATPAAAPAIKKAAAKIERVAKKTATKKTA